MISLNLSIPTHIIVGDHEQTAQKTLNLLRSLWCKQGGENCFCSICKQLSHHQHRFLAWLKPTKDYTVDDLNILFQITSLALDEDQLFFFVLEQSEKLTLATANRLLKSLEEPPAGYHFILLTSNLNALLPTIISRSEVITLARTQVSEPHPLISFFLKGAPLLSVQDFEVVLQRQKLSDSESQQLLDELFEHLQSKLVEAIKDNREEQAQLSAATAFVHEAMKMPPQSGSSDLFWKNLWVNFPRDV